MTPRDQEIIAFFILLLVLGPPLGALWVKYMLWIVEKITKGKL